MKKFDWAGAGIDLILYGIFAAGFYICGHTACAYEHVESDEWDCMLRDKDGNLSNKHYIVEAFKDCKRMIFG